MTTYQDSPLQSRRAARQGERAEAATTVGTVPDSSESAARAIADGTAEPLHYATTDRPPLPQYDGHNLRPRRTVDSADHLGLTPTEALPDQDAPNYRPRDFSPEGRRAALGGARQVGGVGAEGVGSEGVRSDGTVDFQTQWRENVPVGVTDVPGVDLVPTHVVEAPALPDATATLSPAEYTMTRRELRALREAGLITDVTDLSQPIHLPVMAGPVVEAPTADVIPAEVPAAVSPIADPVPLVAPAPQSSSRLDSALAEFDALAAGRGPAVTSPDAPAPITGRRAAASPVEESTALPEAEAESSTELSAETERSSGWEFAPPEPLPPSTEGLSAFDALFQPPSAAIPAVVALPLDDDEVHHDVVQAELEPDTTPGIDEVSESASAPSTAAQLLAPPDPQGALWFVPPPPMYPGSGDLSAPPAVHAPAEVPSFDFPSGSQSEYAVSGPAVGHWSTQADIDDAEQINAATISRSLGAGNGAITTSALVLPSVPDHLLSGPIGEGGEFLLTGSISLPGSLSVTGALPSQLEQPDIDHLLDPGDHQVASTDSAPVRAIRAVSTHTASGGIISLTKPKGTRGFTILIIAASAMALVVVGLLIAGLASGTL